MSRLQGVDSVLSVHTRHQRGTEALDQPERHVGKQAPKAVGKGVGGYSQGRTKKRIRVERVMTDKTQGTCVIKRSVEQGSVSAMQTPK